MFLIVVRLLTMFLCSYGGYEVAALLNRKYISGNQWQALSMAVGIILGLLIGYVVGGVGGRALIRLITYLEEAIVSLSAQEVLFGLLGLFCGFLVALLPSFIFLRFSYPGYIISVFLFCLFGFLGARIGVKKRQGLARILKMSPGESGIPEASLPNYILDTSVIVDGRIVDVAKSGFLEGKLIAPRFILSELQAVADSSDSLKRNRGRRGLEVLNILKRLEEVTLEVSDQDFPEAHSVDGKLIRMGRALDWPVITTDYNLSKIAEIQGVRVLNINELANVLKPVALPGESLTVKIIRGGTEPGQGVGYLDDGTMVVVEKGKKLVGEEKTVVVTSVLQTPAGKMIFTELGEES